MGWRGRAAPAGQRPAAAKPLLRDFSTWPSLGGSPCSPATEEGGEAEGAPSPGVSRTGPGRGCDVPAVSYDRSDAWQPLPVSSGRHVLCHLSGTYSTNEPLAQATRKVIGVSLVLVLDSLRRENRCQCVTVSSALVRQSSLAVICICV